MSEENPGKQTKGISRRAFVAGAGAAVVGAAVGAVAASELIVPKQVIKTVTQTQTATQASTATSTQTTTQTVIQATAPQYVNVTVNGQAYQLEMGVDFAPSDTLNTTLRDGLGLTGTKLGCDQGACGACTVIKDGQAVLSCSTLTAECDGNSITTVEGLQDPTTGTLDPIQQAFIDNHGFQCGYCTPGQIMSTKALLTSNPNPTLDQIKQALAGNVCRCTGYEPILNSVQAAIKTIGGGS